MRIQVTCNRSGKPGLPISINIIIVNGAVIFFRWELSEVEYLSIIVDDFWKGDRGHVNLQHLLLAI